MRARTIVVDSRKYRLNFSSEGLIACVREQDTGTRIGFIISTLDGGWKVRETLNVFSTPAKAARSLVQHHLFNTEGIVWSAIS